MNVEGTNVYIKTRIEIHSSPYSEDIANLLLGDEDVEKHDGFTLISGKSNLIGWIRGEDNSTLVRYANDSDYYGIDTDFDLFTSIMANVSTLIDDTGTNSK